MTGPAQTIVVRRRGPMVLVHGADHTVLAAALAPARRGLPDGLVFREPDGGEAFVVTTGPDRGSITAGDRELARFTGTARALRVWLPGEPGEDPFERPADLTGGAVRPRLWAVHRHLHAAPATRFALHDRTGGSVVDIERRRTTYRVRCTGLDWRVAAGLTVALTG